MLLSICPRRAYCRAYRVQENATYLAIYNISGKCAHEDAVVDVERGVPPHVGHVDELPRPDRAVQWRLLQRAWQLVALVRQPLRGSVIRLEGRLGLRGIQQPSFAAV